MTLSFSTKAQTLLRLKGRIKTAKIADILIFTVNDWRADRSKCLNRAKTELGIGPWIVRSSSSQEDGYESSGAGVYDSKLNVTETDLEQAIDEVIESYITPKASDEILIQPMLCNVVRSGVVFSHDPNTNAPYRVVNWSDHKDTNVVTGGLGGRLWYHAAKSPVQPPTEMAPVLNLLDELLEIFGGQPLDLEFAVSSPSDKLSTDETLWLLQVRPLIISCDIQCPSEQSQYLQTIYEKVKRGMKPQVFLRGKTTVYGVMPDWNPAEIIGVRPKPLAMSLYRELITDSIWAYQRHNYGYRNLRSFSLMPHFMGLPYIDVRISFNSFIPADLDEVIAGRLLDYYLKRLTDEPSLHDKVEFEIVLSCYTLDIDQNLEQIETGVLSAQDRDNLKRSLLKLTNRIIDPEKGLWKRDAAKLDILQDRFATLLSSNSDNLEKIYWLLEDAKRYGTLPFAGLARAAFIAVQMLKSLVTVGVLSEHDYNAFINSISTVSRNLSIDRSTLDKTKFLERYGHLRPGSYDILSPRYDESPQSYFDWNKKIETQSGENNFRLNPMQQKKLTQLLRENDLAIDSDGLISFIRSVIELRELSKFYFTKNLSEVLVLISKITEQTSFSKDDVAFCNINIFKEAHMNVANIEELMSESIKQGKEAYAATKAIALPPLITKPEDVWSFEWPESEPNFITQEQVTAPVTQLGSNSDLEGKIICIPNADPGFDWLFSHPIAGLVTAWGGPNSHMAIRAGELRLPALIGAGEVFYQKISGAHILHLDCAGKRFEIVQ